MEKRRGLPGYRLWPCGSAADWEWCEAVSGGCKAEASRRPSGPLDGRGRRIRRFSLEAAAVGEGPPASQAPRRSAPLRGDGGAVWESGLVAECDVSSRVVCAVGTGIGLAVGFVVGIGVRGDACTDGGLAFGLSVRCC